MAWNDPFETFVGATGQAYVAPVGTAFPAGGAAPAAAWVGLGYASDDGVAVHQETNTEDIPAWQSLSPIRRLKTGEAFTLALALLQWNESNVPLAFGGGVVASVASGYEYTPPAQSDALDERAVLCDVVDGSRVLRFKIKRATISDAVESVFKRGSVAELPITLAALEPDDGSQIWSFWTSDVANFAAGS